MKLLKYVVTKKFNNFLPDPGDFEIKNENVPVLKKGQFLVKAEYISTDPYLRSFADSQVVPYEQFGFQVGKVIDSKNPEYPINMIVVSHSGWRDYAILNGEPDEIFRIKPYDPQIGDLPLSLAVGALGMPGMTAYLGFLEICKPEKENVVCVTSAAGAVGSLVGQIAKLKGCKVIGFTGTDEKVRILQEELGFDHVFNHKKGHVKEAIHSVASGIDCYFDNVGGELSFQIMECMRDNGRIAACGSISTYGSKPVCRRPSRPLMAGGVKIEAFSFTQWEWPQQKAAIHQLRDWMNTGNIKTKETIVNGFAKLPDTLIALLKGDMIGKAVVKI